MNSEITEAKFVEVCRWPKGHTKDRPGRATFGGVCHEHSADLRDLIADVYDLMIAYAEQDAIAGEQAPGFVPGSRVPPGFRLNAWIIGHPGNNPDDVIAPNRRHNANPVTGRLESNGPDAPDIRALIYDWCDRIAAGEAFTNWPNGDSLAKMDYIRQHLDKVSQRDDFRDFLKAMRDCRRALAAAIGEQPGPPSLGPCPYCKANLFTDRDKEIIRRRRKGEHVTGEDAQPITARADQVKCGCGVSWEGLGLTRLKLMMEQKAS